MLSADTVRRVMVIAENIGYVPNHTARALSTGRYGNVALVVPDVANPFFPPLIRAAQGAITDALEALRSTPPEELFAVRTVGRQALPTNVIGLLFHLAEHTQRHTGQVKS